MTFRFFAGVQRKRLMWVSLNPVGRMMPCEFSMPRVSRENTFCSVSWVQLYKLLYFRFYSVKKLEYPLRVIKNYNIGTKKWMVVVC